MQLLSFDCLAGMTQCHKTEKSYRTYEARRGRCFAETDLTTV